MYSFLIVLYVLVSAALIGLVLLQHGKGADAGAAFGSGASGTVFGARGSATFLSRTTAWLAAVFFALSLALAYVVHGREAPTSVMDQRRQPKPRRLRRRRSPRPSRRRLRLPRRLLPQSVHRHRRRRQTRIPTSKRRPRRCRTESPFRADVAELVDALP